MANRPELTLQGVCIAQDRPTQRDDQQQLNQVVKSQSQEAIQIARHPPAGAGGGGVGEVGHDPRRGGVLAAKVSAARVFSVAAAAMELQHHHSGPDQANAHKGASIEALTVDEPAHQADAH